MSLSRLIAFCLLLLAIPEASFAHTPIQGIGNFLNGMLHPLLVPAQLLLLLAFGLFIGQQGSAVVVPTLTVFAFAIFSGLTASWFAIAYANEVIILVIAVAIGLSIAIAPKVTVLWCGLVALMSGFILGLDSAQDELAGKDKLVTLFGSGLSMYFLVLYPLALADFLSKKTWQKIIIRIIGSWVAASALLVLALSFSKQTLS